MAQGMTKRLTQLNRSVAGKAVIVTGAASGMGRATAHLFADEGARVVVADLGEERVAKVVAEITAVHGANNVVGVVADVTSDTDRRRVVDTCLSQFGVIDVLVNNAGISVGSSVFTDDDVTVADLDADGRPDIVVANKRGVFAFRQRRP